MKRILLPYDFSKVSEYALDFACQIACNAKSEIMLLHVIEQPTEDSFKTMGMQNVDPMEALYIKRMYEKVQSKLADVISSADYSNISSKIQLGNPFNTILDHILCEKVSLLVVGTEGSNGLDTFFAGSNTQKIVRRASCPVITLQDKHELDPIEKIVFASDFQHTDHEFVSKLKEFQQTFEAQLNIVKINTPASFASTRHDKKQMKGFVDKYALNNYTIDIYNYKNEEDGIIHYADDIGADMIALGTHQRKGVGHFLAGSIAEDVVNHSRFPVWTSHLNS